MIDYSIKRVLTLHIEFARCTKYPLLLVVGSRNRGIVLLAMTNGTEFFRG